MTFVDKWQFYEEPVGIVLAAIPPEMLPDWLPEKTGWKTDMDETEDESSHPGTGNSGTDGEGNGTDNPGVTGEENGSGNPGAPGEKNGSGNPGVTGEENEIGNPGGNNSATGGEADGNDNPEVQSCFSTVEDDYFADALFIGDSRTVGMYEYGGLEDISTFYAATGLTVYKLFDSAIVTVPGQKKKITVEEALQSNQFQKIYLMIGINEMGTGTVESFAKKYEEVVNHLRELQPEAIIYIQGIMKVTTARSEQGDYITNEGIEARNEAISLLEDKERIFYLDVNPELCDETGGLKEEYTFDGVHLKAQYIEIWKDFLKTHAIL